MLQHSSWMWTYAPMATYVRWAKHYQFPTSYLLLHQNQPVFKAAQETNLTRHSSSSNGICTTAMKAPDFTGVLLFPIDCNTVFSSRYACGRYYQYPYAKGPLIGPDMPKVLGYSLQKWHHDPSILVISHYICPNSYNIFLGKKCLRFIPFPAASINYIPCSTNPFLNLQVRQVNCYYRCYMSKIQTIEVVKKINQTCVFADNTSSVFSINKENSYSESKYIREYMFQVLPSTSRALHYNYSGVRTFDTISGDHCLCRNTLVCQLHPAVKAVTNIYNPHFVLCARDPMEKPAIEAPIQFQHFMCADDSFIGATLQCDGIPDCPVAEDEYNCSNICTSNSGNCFSECAYPTCRCHDYYYQCLSGECVTFDRLCNGQHDCSKGEDEHGCEIAQKAIYNVSLTFQDVDSNTGFCYGSAEYLPCFSQKRVLQSAVALSI